MNCVTAGNVMVQLFLQTQSKYRLSNKKLQYLLCIAQIASLNNGRALFDGGIRNLKNCFSIDVIGDNFVCNSNIQEGNTSDKVLDYSVKDFVIPYSAKQIYSFKEPIDETDKLLLIHVFINFGGYNEGTLCDLLNEFDSLRALPLWSEISAEDIKVFLSTSFKNELLKNNKVLSFVREYNPNYEDKENVLNVLKKEDKKLHEYNTSSIFGLLVNKEILKNFSSQSLNQLSADKEYVVYIETKDKKPVKDVIVLSLSQNIRVKGILKKISDTLYQYSFMSPASNVKIRVDI